MLQRLRMMFDRSSQPAPLPDVSVENVPLAVAALLLHEALNDESLEESEKQTIIVLLMKKFKCTRLEALQLMQQAMEHEDDDEHFYHYVKIVKENLNDHGREGIIEMLWSIAYANDEMSDGEVEMVHRIANMLYVSEARCKALQDLAKSKVDSIVQSYS